jgi:hypothetical protein
VFVVGLFFSITPSISPARRTCSPNDSARDIK